MIGMMGNAHFVQVSAIMQHSRVIRLDTNHQPAHIER
jgi:hypothetical protein